MSYRPITDVWILGRSKVKYYGAYPAGFLHRARHLLGARLTDPVLHVCAGRIRQYPYRGLGRLDCTLDLDATCRPDFLQDARAPYPLVHTYRGPGASARLPEALVAVGEPWAAVLADPPYTAEDATHYVPGPEALPTANTILRNSLAVVAVGGLVGILDYVWPQPPRTAREVAVIAVTTGRNNRARFFTVFERLS
jgi:hypothetical protein